MSKLKFQFPFSAPTRDDGTHLLAALAALLAATLIGQLMVGSPADLPTPAIGASSMRAPALRLSAEPVVLDGGIVAHNIFAPGRSQTGIIGKIPGIALGGVVVAGTLGTRGGLRAVIVKPGGIVTMLPPGGVINDWQLVRLLPDHAEFRRGSSKLDMPFGGAIPQGAETGERTDQ